MAIYAAIQRVKDARKQEELLQQHLAYLGKMKAQGSIYAAGPFTDGAGGLVFYLADSLEEANRLASEDPFIKEQTASLEVHEWYDAKDKL